MKYIKKNIFCADGFPAANSLSSFTLKSCEARSAEQLDAGAEELSKGKHLKAGWRRSDINK
jgi:hypothetical protein